MNTSTGPGRLSSTSRRRRRAALSTARAGALVTLFIAFAFGSTASADPPGKIEVDGVVANVKGTCPSLEFTVAQQRIVTNASTRFEDGRCEDIADGKMVEIDAFAEAKGELRASKVDLD